MHNHKKLKMIYKNKIEQIKKFVRKEGIKYLQDRNINSVGIGYKRKAGKRSKTLCLQFTVNNKIQLESLGSMGTREIPKFLSANGLKIPTDIIQQHITKQHIMVKPENLQKNDTKIKHGYVLPGVSISNRNIDNDAGTLGCFVYDNETGNICILSNWHVLHNGVGKIGDDIVQPGTFDYTPTDKNVVGKLLRYHLGLAGDCAICSVEGIGVNPNILGLELSPKRIAKVEIGDKVIKSGRTSGVTQGTVNRIEVISKIDYGGQEGEVKINGFEIYCDPEFKPNDGEISKPGDSGSAWIILDKNNNPTDIIAGLHFAGGTGENGEELALACNAYSVFKKLNISLTPPI